MQRQSSTCLQADVSTTGRLGSSALPACKLVPGSDRLGSSAASRVASNAPPSLLPEHLLKAFVSRGEPGFLEVYPKNSTRQPHLLERLQDLLAKRQRAAVRLACGAAPGASLPGAAAGLSLAVHRQLLDAFMVGFATYRPLLARIKAAYEDGLQTGLRCAHENLTLRAELAAVVARRAAATAAARRDALEGSALMHAELAARLREAESQADEAAARAQRLEAQAVKAWEEADSARAEQASLQAQRDQLAATLAGQAAWATSARGAATAQLALPACSAPLERNSRGSEAAAAPARDHASTPVQRQGSGLPRQTSGLPRHPSGLPRQASGLPRRT